MKRRIYKALLGMHPASFRQRFALEMMWIFDESRGEISLLIDGAFSLVRQWVAKLGFWKIAGALLGATLQIFAGGFIWLLLTTSSRPVATGPLQDADALRHLMRLIIWGAGTTTMMVILASLWLRSFAARRSQAR